MFSIINHIKNGKNQSEIAHLLNRSQNNIAYHFAKLKASRVIEQIGYGVWIVTKNNIKTTSKTKVGNPLTFHPTTSKLHTKYDEIRGHSFRFRVQLPKVDNWSKREIYLKKNHIKYDVINKGYTHKILVKDHIVWLSSGSIVVYFKKGYSVFAESAGAAEERAFFELVSLMKRLESMFKVSFRIGKSFKVKLFGSHNALMRNGLAKEYNRNKEKLRVYSKDGLWLLIDDSFGLDELETVHPSSSKSDMDGVIKPFFNGLKEFPFVPQDHHRLAHAVLSLTDNTNLYVENIKSHLSAIQELRDSMKDIKKLVEFVVLGDKK